MVPWFSVPVVFLVCVRGLLGSHNQTAPQCISQNIPSSEWGGICLSFAAWFLCTDHWSLSDSLQRPLCSLQLICRGSTWLSKYFLHICYEENTPDLPSCLDPWDLMSYLAPLPPVPLHPGCCLHVSDFGILLFWSCLPFACFSLTPIRGIAFFRTFLGKGAFIKCAGPSLWLQLFLLFPPFLHCACGGWGWPLWSSTWPAFLAVRTTTVGIRTEAGEWGLKGDWRVWRFGWVVVMTHCCFPVLFALASA